MYESFSQTHAKFGSIIIPPPSPPLCSCLASILKLQYIRNELNIWWAWLGDAKKREQKQKLLNGYTGRRWLGSSSLSPTLAVRCIKSGGTTKLHSQCCCCGAKIYSISAEIYMKHKFQQEAKFCNNLIKIGICGPIAKLSKKPKHP